jgi:hypothetical protein
VIAQSISHYRIVEKLGGGGMGGVCKTEDTKLGVSSRSDVITRFSQSFSEGEWQGLFLSTPKTTYR